MDLTGTLSAAVADFVKDRLVVEPMSLLLLLLFEFWLGGESEFDCFTASELLSSGEQLPTFPV